MNFKIKCRGEVTRRNLVKKYELTPIAHLKLLNGQKKWSCTGDPLTDSYYCFSFERRDTKKTGVFLCGSHAAKHFLELLGKDSLPLFNPLISEGSSSSYTESKEIGSIMQWNETAKQLLNAINLLMVCWDTVPGVPLREIKAKIEQNSGEKPRTGQIKAVNKIISTDRRSKRKLSKMLEELSKKNHIRNFNFDALNKELDKLGEPSFFS